MLLLVTTPFLEDADYRRAIAVCSVITVLILTLPGSVRGEPPTSPVADAGLSRYAARDPIRLDGRGSYDPDGDPIITYEWTQISGPEVVISDPTTATPEISSFAQTVYIQTVEISLVVSDGVDLSSADTVEVIIVPRMTHKTMSLINGPFRPDLPTMIGFGGGNCIDGGPFHLNAFWQERFNVISGEYFFPYADHAYQIMVLLSDLAPDYQESIQTVGFSTGGNPASVVPNIINQYFPDPRYAVNRMTLLDTYCDDDLHLKVGEFNSHPVAGEPAWVDVYRSAPEPIPGALNVSFFPGGDHNTPMRWYLASALPDNWPDGDMYNQGVTAGYFVSVDGPARNLRIATEGLTYYFECPHVEVDCLRQTNGALYPGLLPEPVALIGPEDGAAVGPEGVVLTCEESQHAVSYELLLGPDPTEMTVATPPTPTPPDGVVAEFPTTPTYWTIRIRDEFGSTIFAPPRAIFTYEPTPPRSILRRAIPDP